MIRYTTGNLLNAPVEALVNTVNEVGVMGKGIALMFRDAFPSNTRAYQRAAKSGDVSVGRMFVTTTGALVGPKWIINFPTKKHWRDPSKLEWVRDGLRDLVRVVREYAITSLAVPPLGCGNGGLDWAAVRREIEAIADELPGVEVIVFEPTTEYQNAPKRLGVQVLTPARSLVVEAVRQYSVLGMECTILEVQKLAWFLDRSLKSMCLPDPLGLDFVADKYGPYADKLRHLLDSLDGSFLHCDKHLSDAGPFDLIWFDPAKRDTLASYLATPEMEHYAPGLTKTVAIIDGFESPLGMELLATVDWLIAAGSPATIDGVRASLASWPGGSTAARRKLAVFDDRLLGLAIDRLVASGLVA